MAPKQTDPQFKLRMTPEIKEAIEKAAAFNNRSMNAEILHRLSQTLEMDSYVPEINAHVDGDETPTELRITLDSSKVPINGLEAITVISTLLDHLGENRYVSVVSVTPEQYDDTRTSIEKANLLNERLRALYPPRKVDKN